jgi:hypothetical protein
MKAQLKAAIDVATSEHTIETPEQLATAVAGWAARMYERAHPDVIVLESSAEIVDGVANINLRGVR